MSIRVAFVAEGDANTADCWSGSGRSFVQALRSAGTQVDLYDAELTSWRRAIAAGLTYHPTRERWRQRYALGAVPFLARSARVGRALADAKVRYDAVIQVGATFELRGVAQAGAPYVLYCDSNLAYARRGAPFSAASRLGTRELEGALRRERHIYDSATRIWTMSNALASSFATDFAQPAAKMETIYAGANNPPSPTTVATSGPRILFVGKDHVRKGSAVLLQAFEKVRAAVPDAELHFVGGVPQDAVRPGVVVHGIVSRATPAGAQLLDQLFGSASVFCMPSRYEPFGIAFVEAMLAGLPCVGTNAWAMPEIIDDGNTGWLVPDGSVENLAAVLIAALRNPAECARRGQLGRERALARFTWHHVAARAIADLLRLRDATSTRRASMVT
jgi:glycosyltransferase involved in cell wall biosynthesis